jgi:hypothetical protein
MQRCRKENSKLETHEEILHHIVFEREHTAIMHEWKQWSRKQWKGRWEQAHEGGDDIIAEDESFGDLTTSFSTSKDSIIKRRGKKRIWP